MLVLTRKSNEAIQIGKDITVTICSIGHDKVKIGIDAPKKIDIRRIESKNDPKQE